MKSILIQTVSLSTLFLILGGPLFIICLGSARGFIYGARLFFSATLLSSSITSYVVAV